MTEIKKKLPKAILFDLDGVLVDMPDAHYQALNQALQLFGANIGKEEHYNFFNGLPTKKKLAELENSGRLPSGLTDFINDIKQQHTKELIPKFCVPNHAKLILLKHLKAHGFILGCCSNSTAETLHLMLKSAQLFDYFDAVIGNDDVDKPKPDPEMYILAMGKLNVLPEETIIVEDSPHGIAAAKASGATVRIVRTIEDVDLSLFADILNYA